MRHPIFLRRNFRFCHFHRSPFFRNSFFWVIIEYANTLCLLLQICRLTSWQIFILTNTNILRRIKVKICHTKRKALFPSTRTHFTSLHIICVLRCDQVFGLRQIIISEVKKIYSTEACCQSAAHCVSGSLQGEVLGTVVFLGANRILNALRNFLIVEFRTERRIGFSGDRGNSNWGIFGKGGFLGGFAG